MNKPNLTFLVPGFSKCGTTSLCNLLNLHPDIYIPEEKEPMFFIHREYESHWEHYTAYFSSSKKHCKLGEGSTFYTAIDHEREARARILLHYPDIRIILIARDPINRIESSFREFHHSGPRFALDTPYDLHHALVELPALIGDTSFWSRLNNYKAHMDEANIHILLLEELETQPEKELRKCFAFLGVDSQISLSTLTTRLNTGESKLYDTRLLRWMRAKGLVTPPHTEELFNRQNVQLERWQLRKHFSKPIFWSSEAKRYVRESLGDDIEQFLTYTGKSKDLWPRYKMFYDNYRAEFE